MCQKIENMFLTSSSFFNSSRQNVILPSSNVGRLYQIHFTLLVSPELSPWLISSSWSLRPFNVILMYRTMNIWGFPPLKPTLTSNWSVIVSDLHHKKKLNNKWKNSFKHFIKHLECKLYINPKTHNYNINMQTSKHINHIQITCKKSNI